MSVTIRTPSAAKRLAAIMIHAVKSRIKVVGARASHLAETFFYSWGHAVASHPCKFILATLAVTALSLLGLLNFSSEADGWKIWLPEGTRDAIHSVLSLVSPSNGNYTRQSKPCVLAGRISFEISSTVHLE